MRLHVALTALAALVLLAPTGAAFTQVTLAAQEGPDCPTADQKLYCLTVTEGQLDGVQQGELIQISLINEGEAPHNAYVTTADNADTDTRDTAADDAFANTSTIGGGEETNASFTVPSDAESLYIWCEIDNHEIMGMWIEVSVDPAPEAGNGTEEGADDGAGDTGEDEDREQAPDEDSDGIPVPSWAALVALLGALLIGRSRNS